MTHNKRATELARFRVGEAVYTHDQFTSGPFEIAGVDQECIHGEHQHLCYAFKNHDRVHSEGYMFYTLEGARCDLRKWEELRAAIRRQQMRQSDS